MLSSQGGEKHERDLTTESDKGSSGSSKAGSPAQTVIQPLCGCSLLSQSPVVVFTCPKCMKAALRAMELLDA